MTLLPELDQRLAQMEHVFRAPPLTPELLAAIKLITPHFDLAPVEHDRLFWEADQNGSCWGEYEVLEPYLSRIPSDAKILEIGPGMGRSLVFFAKKLGWSDKKLHAYDGNGQTTKYTLLGPRFDDSFCGNIAALRHILDFNGIRDVTIIDAAKSNLRDLPGLYDLIYSFYGIGFHWSLEHFLDDLLPLLRDGGTAIFTTTVDFEPFDSLRNISFRLVDFKKVWPKDAAGKLIVLSKATPLSTEMPMAVGQSRAMSPPASINTARTMPAWTAENPDASNWAEILSVSPTIIHTWLSLGFPLGAASAIGPGLWGRAVHFLIMPSSTLEEPGSSTNLAKIATSYLVDHPGHELTFLCNTIGEMELMHANGFAALTINQNCLVDDLVFRPIPEIEPIYDAVYNARLHPGKRHELASQIDKLALIYFYAGTIEASPAEFHAVHAHWVTRLPTARFVNELTPEGCRWLSGHEVNKVLAQSRVGLCLSRVEGAMLVAIEYLLAGLPIVATPSLGGRDYFFDNGFCTIVDPDPRQVREAVDALVARNIPREYVRAKTLARVTTERRRYIAFVQELIDRGRGNGRFEDRFWECTRGNSILRWRSMKEFSETVTRTVFGTPHTP